MALMYLGVVVMWEGHVIVPARAGLRRRRIPQASIHSVDMGEAAHFFAPIRFPVLQLDGDESLELRALGWYPLYRNHIPRRVARFGKAMKQGA